MSGSLDFTANLKDVGGLQGLARTNYARNMWLIMREFKALPSVDGTFRTLTSKQINFILAEMDLDAKEEEAAANGQRIDYGNSYFDNDDSWWEHPETATIKETPEEIEATRKQLSDLMDEDTKNTLYENLARVKTTYDRQDQEQDSESADAIVQDRIDAMYDIIDSYKDNPDELQEYRKALKQTTVASDEQENDDTDNSTSNTKTIMNTLDGGN